MDNHGVLVGWTHHEMGNKFILNLQTIKQPNTPNDVNRMAVLLTKGQAALLGNYLFQIAGQSPQLKGSAPSGSGCLAEPHRRVAVWLFAASQTVR